MESQQIQSPDVHLDHMFKATRMIHMELSGMADMKANILLTMATVVITFTFRHITDPLLKEPIILLLVFCLLTMMTAVYVVMPHLSIPIGKKSRQQAKEMGFNLLFFGHFAQMEAAEYEAAMLEMIQHPDEIYKAQIREIYQLGRFLATKKYRFLRLAYIFFISGLMLCITTLVLKLALHGFSGG